MQEENADLARLQGQAEHDVRALRADTQFYKDELARVQADAEAAARAHARAMKELQAEYMDASSRLDQQTRDHTVVSSNSAAVARSLKDTRAHYEKKLTRTTDRAQRAEAKVESLRIKLRGVRSAFCFLAFSFHLFFVLSFLSCVCSVGHGWDLARALVISPSASPCVPNEHV